MIPKTVHYIFGLKPDFGGKPFSYVHYLCALSAKVALKPDQILIHYRYRPQGIWWDKALEFCTARRIENARVDSYSHVRHFAHRADFIRLDLLSEFGGVYLDMDVFCLRDFDALLGHRTVLGVEPNTGLCNAVILAAQGAPFIARWRAEYERFSDSKWNAFSVRLPYRLARAAPQEIHVEDMYAFFFPAYSDPASAWLWRDEPCLSARLKLFLSRLPRLRFYLYRDRPVRVFRQMGHAFRSRDWCYERLRRARCLHLWESLWWAPHLAEMSPETLEAGEGLFPRLVKDVFGQIPR